MARNRDYIPRPLAQFNEWYANLINYIKQVTFTQENPWTHIPAQEGNAFVAAFDAWTAAYTPTLGPHTPGQRVARDEARRTAERLIRPFVQRYLMWPPVTDEDRTNMRLPVRDTIRTDHTTVTEKVAATLGPGNIREVVIHFWIEGADHRAKPDGYDGAVLIYAVAEAPLTRIEDLSGGHTMASRTPHTLVFTDDQRGKIVSVALCWQNERGIRGEWGEILSTVIP